MLPLLNPVIRSFVLVNESREFLHLGYMVIPST